ncbi:hypothetical protein [Thioalkalivibrio sp.]|uniref:hypothetical protein n=1 Tax=Thioalkalivibrio sp. TaxID=2093813 RepID=UPI00356163F1
MVSIHEPSDLEKVPDPAVRGLAACRLLELNPEPPSPSDWPDATATLYVVEDGDDVAGPDYAFVGPRGLLSDLWDERKVGDRQFTRPFEWVCHHADRGVIEALLLLSDDEGAIILVPDDLLFKYPDLQWVLTSPEAGGLVEPAPCP